MKPSVQRVAFSPAEFAALFGKSQAWGYRQIYEQRVKAITEFGRIRIPASEVERILASAGNYDGLKLPRTKAQFQKSTPQFRSAWQDFLAKRRGAKTAQPQIKKKADSARSAALARLGRRATE